MATFWLLMAFVINLIAFPFVWIGQELTYLAMLALKRGLQ